MYHNKDVKDIFREFGTNEDGLDSEEAKKRFDKYGPNSLKKEKETSLLKIIFNQFADPLIYILIIAGVFTFFIQEYTDMWVIFAIIIVNAIVGFFQEFKAEKAMDAIRSLAAPKATVLRGGEEFRIDSKELVPGDIVVLSAGSKVPADMRIFLEKELETDESALTGESTTVSKDAGKIKEKDVAPADMANMAFMGTVATSGSGRGIIIATGKNTELGEISGQVKRQKKSKTPLQKRLADFGKKIGILSAGLAVFVFATGVIQGKAVREMILFSISMAVAVIPEGLPVVITITMAIGIERMAKRSAIVRKLVAVETLGSCNYICSDKTGTITENSMTLVKFNTGKKEYEFSGRGYNPAGTVISGGKKIHKDKDLEKALIAGFLCNDSSHYKEDGKWKIKGDPTEGALIVAAKKYGIDPAKTEYENKYNDEIQFSSKRKYMATRHNKREGDVIFVKGAPEKVLGFCKVKDRNKFFKISKKMAGEGLRVLALAYRNVKDSKDISEKEIKKLEFLGFAGMIDPPRREVIEAVKSTKKAGIKTVMITGDHKVTAGAVAGQINISGKGGGVVTGSELEEKGEDFLRKNVEKISVYARVLPLHKLRIIRALQDKGKTVAVTGDGVNDAPALKRSDIGVSMGMKGTDVAREASDMILKDDNFATIFEAVKTGRVIYDNIKKVVYFLLSAGIGETISILSALFTGFPLPFLASQILWINLAACGVQDVALAFEPGEENIEKRKPRDPDENIIDLFLIKRLFLTGMVMGAGTFMVFVHKINSGASLELARTMAMNTMVFFQFFQVFNARSFRKSVFIMNPFKNSLLFISVIFALAAEAAVINIPAMQFVFKTEALSLGEWFHCLGAASAVLIAAEADKLARYIIKKRKGKGE